MLLNDLVAIGKNFEGNEFYKFTKLINKFSDQLSKISFSLYERLDSEDKKVFITWFLLRWGELDTVTKADRDEYLNIVKQASAEPFDNIDISGKTYKSRNYTSQGYDVDLAHYDFFLGIHDLQLDQYTHKEVSVSKGDVIIDAGAFIGDTAAVFYKKTDGDCSIHSFELLPESIDLFKANIKKNNMENNVIINQLALYDVSGEKLSFDFESSEGANKIKENNNSNNSIESISLDDYVKNSKLSSVDFIKMDIEGGEIPALKGSIETIKTFKPKLAICLYHIWTDPILIPEFINSLGVNYNFYFKWVHLTRGWEAVLLASPSVKKVDSPKNTDNASTNDLEDYIIQASKLYEQKYTQAHNLWIKNKS